MANEENLKKGKATQFRSGEEAARNGEKGGKASVASRRRKKSMQQKMKLLLALKPGKEQLAMLNSLGVSDDDADNEMMMLVAMLQAAIEDRDTKAFDRIMDIIGKSVQREELALKKKALAKQEKPNEGKTGDLINGLLEQDHTEDNE